MLTRDEIRKVNGIRARNGVSKPENRQRRHEPGRMPYSVMFMPEWLSAASYLRDKRHVESWVYSMPPAMMTQALEYLSKLESMPAACRHDTVYVIREYDKKAGCNQN